ncbi:putative major facilitator superfamily protein [Hirsutella rhossiliensis]|uniref:Major facilitator superfamily protein n=1 Tax=Hirsutella rhossiliensis TaxID=111463 RepID=A0A9P8N0T4_9HYPO|nr:putative major facilitator superfamily protein [Hirsutella rhossiliensis]KAH0966038.1 putative major facilitator superfamily protein [Hirsutella rhossiliensis]
MAAPAARPCQPQPVSTRDSSSPSPGSFHLSDREQWSSLLLRSARCQRPLLAHLNGDTSWLLQLPRPAHRHHPSRTHFNILVDPWLRGPQSDVAGWFSTQWHLIPPSFDTVADLDDALRDVEARTLLQLGSSPSSSNGRDGDAGDGLETEPCSDSRIDAVVVSHEFTDHCHQATLLEVSPHTPVFAPQVAADLIRSWSHFDRVFTAPALQARDDWSPAGLPAVDPLPDWIAIGRLVAPDNSLYYHSAMLVAFRLGNKDDGDDDSREAILYAPHGVQSRDLDGIRSSGLRPLALLHGLHDVRIWMAKQLNLGALDGIEAVAATGARYWVATHDEDKKGAGLIAPFLRRTRYSLKEAVHHQQQRLREDPGHGEPPDYRFFELGSGDGLCLD